MVAGQYLSIRFAVDPITASAGTNMNWVAITMGASDNAAFGLSGTGARGQYIGNAATNVGMLLRDNGQYFTFNNNTSVGSGTYDSTPTVGLTHQIEIRISGLVDGNPWDGTNSAYFEFLADGNTTPYATYTKTGGSVDNFITLMSNGGGSQFDNLEVWLVPEPSSFILSLFAGIGLLMRRKRHA